MRASDETRHDLLAAVAAAMPGWSFETGPVGFGWAPDRHLRATLRRGDESVCVVIRRSWERERFEKEVRLYRHVLPSLAVATPTLLATFTIDEGGQQWMVLEDLGPTMLQRDRPDDRRAFLDVLGRVHGRGLLLTRGDRLAAGLLPRYADDRHEWRGLLQTAVGSTEYGLTDWVLPMHEGVWTRLARQPMALLHGDTDFSNAIRCGDGRTALVDWERAMIGPPALDLGRVVAAMESPDEFDAYHRSFSEESQVAISAEQIRDWAQAGSAHDALRWICYYIRRTGEGHPPPPEWRTTCYDPCLARLRRAVADDDDTC